MLWIGALDGDKRGESLSVGHFLSPLPIKR
jgi:hypothetical protein